MVRKVILFLVLSSLVFSACQSVDIGLNSDLQKIRLPMGFTPNIQYAPYYVAIEKGYFAEEGLEIEFDYSTETDGVRLVGSNETSFALVSGEQVLLARAQGIPVVYVVAWFQEYPIAIVAKRESGITSIEDLAGKQIGIPGLFGASYVGLRALLNYAGISESDLTLDSIGFNQVAALAADQEQAVVGYFSNEPIQLRAQGYEIVEIRVSDYVQLASNGIITNEQTIAENPDLVQSMVRAFLRGLTDTIADPDEAFEISKKYVEGLADMDETVQKEVLALSIEFWRAENLGYSSADAWKNTQKVMLDMGMLEAELNVYDAYTNDFIR